MAEKFKNINLYATTIMQSKRLIEAGIDDSTADMKYIWQQTDEIQKNFFKRKKVESYRAFTMLEPSIALINHVGDLEVLDDKIVQLKDNGDRSIVFKTKDERVYITKGNTIKSDDIPAWSLTALLNLCPYGMLCKVSDKYFFHLENREYKMFDTAIEAAVDAVCWFKEKGMIE